MRHTLPAALGLSAQTIVAHEKSQEIRQCKQKEEIEACRLHEMTMEQGVHGALKTTAGAVVTCHHFDKAFRGCHRLGRINVV